MRVTKNLLHKLARETANSRKKSEPDLHAAYLTGSLLDDEPLLGGTTDIDLVLVHKYQARVKRETEAVNQEISLDIFHTVIEDYDHHRQLRQDPLLGYPLTRSNILLFDSDHWLEFIQASVSAEFHRTDNVLARVNGFFQQAREDWKNLELTPPDDHLTWLNRYLDTLSNAANAIAGLIGDPLTTRRFLLTYADRTETLGVPKLLAGLEGLLGVSDMKPESIHAWAKGLQEDWQVLFQQGTPPPNLAACRQAYYVKAIQSMTESGLHKVALWPLLRTWLDVRLTTPEPDKGNVWQGCLDMLQLTKEITPEKIAALDAYLDTVEMTIEAWTNVYGI